MRRGRALQADPFFTVRNRSQELPMERKLLKEVFGYDEFLRPPQGEAIRSILKGRDALIVMPTGSGKSLCYQIPALYFPGTTAVLSPLISLMKDQIDQMRALGIEARTLNSSLSPEEYSENAEALLSGKVKSSTWPRRPRSNVRPWPLFARAGVDCIAVDEAHCISEWGHGFPPEYRQLGAFREAFPGAGLRRPHRHGNRPASGATSGNALNFREPGEFIASFNRDNLFYEVVPKSDPIGRPSISWVNSGTSRGSSTASRGRRSTG